MTYLGRYIFFGIIAAIAVIAWIKRESVKALFDKCALFYDDVKKEMKKVTWPTKDEVRGNTIIVLFSVAFLTITIGAVDFVLSNVVKLFLAPH